MTIDDIETRRVQLNRIPVNGNYPTQIIPTGVGIGTSNLTDVLACSQLKIDRVMETLAEKLATVEARATFNEKVTITPEAIVIERQMTMAKDRKY
jgi:hypothetical protein